jgi:hypothetical protein
VILNVLLPKYYLTVLAIPLLRYTLQRVAKWGLAKPGNQIMAEKTKMVSKTKAIIIKCSNVVAELRQLALRDTVANFMRLLFLNCDTTRDIKYFVNAQKKRCPGYERCPKNADQVRSGLEENDLENVGVYDVPVSH